MAIEMTDTLLKQLLTGDEDALMTVKQAAKFLAVSEHQVRRYYEGGQLEIVPLGSKAIRVRLGALRAFVTKRRETRMPLNAVSH
jgi:predicted site-specific integrase-resolvase